MTSDRDCTRGKGRRTASGLIDHDGVCLSSIQAMTAQQEQQELSQRVHELETATSLPSTSPPPPLLSSPSAARLKRTAGAANLPPALPPFVKRIRRMDAECQTTLEDKEVQTDEEGMVRKRGTSQSDGNRMESARRCSALRLN